MPLGNPYDPVIDALQAICKEWYHLPDGRPVFVSGGEVYRLRPQELPVAVIEFDDGVNLHPGDTAQNGVAVNDLGSAFTVVLWCFRATTPKQADPLLMMRELTELRNYLYGNAEGRKLRGTANNTLLRKIDWTGTSRAWPVEVGDKGAGVVAGYISLDAWLVESRFG